MKTRIRWSGSGRRCHLLAVALASFSLAAAPAAMSAEAIFLDSATLTSSGNTITATRVPVTNSAGKIRYQDIRIEFDVSTAGVVTLRRDFPTISTSPNLSVGAFTAGNYLDVNNCRFVVSGPGTIPGTSRTSWSIQKQFNSGCGSSNQFNGSWITGAVSGHPDQAALDSAGITSTAFAYGKVGSEQYPSPWDQGDILGAAQTANNLVIRNYSGSDPNSDAEFTLVKCAAAC